MDSSGWPSDEARDRCEGAQVEHRTAGEDFYTFILTRKSALRRYAGTPIGTAWDGRPLRS